MKIDNMVKIFLEDIEEGVKAHETLEIADPKLFNILSTDLARKIISLLSKEPMCAMDVARRLKQHEQKIYYHIRKMEKMGLVRLMKTEERVGAFAKIYAAEIPVVSFKLFEGKSTLDTKTKIKEIRFFENFIEKGQLSSTIIIGSPDPHGKYSAISSDGYSAIDLALFLGSLVKEAKLPNYKLDTHVKENELKDNLILVGGPKANIIVDKVNKNLPIYFDYHREWNIVSTFSKNVYTEDNIGLIVKMENPFNPKKKILVLAGKRFNGTRASMLAIIKHLKEIEKGNHFHSKIIARVVQGIDKDSDGVVDDVEFLE